jgi:hypothetical protein
MSFLQFFKKISKAKIEYLIAGGMAVNFHGIIRPTHDLDLIIHLTKENILKFIRLIEKLGYLSRLPINPIEFAEENKRRNWIEEKNMVVFSFYHKDDSMRVIDVFVEHPKPFDEMYKRRFDVDLDGISLPVVGIQDLVSMKKKAGRNQDKSDILNLRKVEKINASQKNKKNSST